MLKNFPCCLVLRHYHKLPRQREPDIEVASESQRYFMHPDGSRAAHQAEDAAEVFLVQARTWEEREDNPVDCAQGEQDCYGPCHSPCAGVEEHSEMS
eukprot:765915-Hanusia_phi.AAC.5